MFGGEKNVQLLALCKSQSQRNTLYALCGHHVVNGLEKPIC